MWYAVATDRVAAVRLPVELVALAVEIAEFEGLSLLEAFGLAADQLPDLTAYARDWDLMEALYAYA